MAKKDSAPRIETVSPGAAIPGGEIQIRGASLATADAAPVVSIGDVAARLLVTSDSLVIAKVPEGAAVSEVSVSSNGATSPAYTCDIGIQIAEGIHPVGNPAVDDLGNVYTTFSGSRGQKTPVAVYKIDLNYNARHFVPDLMNATGLAFSPEGVLHVSSRFDGVVYQVNGAGDLSVYCEGMGTATGLAFDRSGNLYVGDRSGTIFKISPDRQIYVYATLEQSLSAYHLAFDDYGNLFVAGPTTSSYEVIHKIDGEGNVTVFYRGLGRPQGIAFDAEGNLYCCASLKGRRGVVRITPDGQNAELCVSGPGIVGLAFTPSKAMVVATNNALYRIDAGIKGRMLPVNAEIIAVGSEMLGATRVDTNSLYITDQLTALGVEVVAKAVIGDDLALLTETVRTSMGRSQIVILTGGLGPTEDDLTREAVAEALGVGQSYREEIYEHIAGIFAKMGRKISENNKRQANVIDGAEVLPNGKGTAPGQWIRTPVGGVIMLIPGPPREMTFMWDNECRPRLEAMLPKAAIRTKWYRVAGMAESELDHLIAPAYKPYTNPVTTVLAKAGDIEVHLRARCATAHEAQALVDEVGAKIEALLGDRIYSYDGSALDAVVGRLLKERGETIAVAESCTGGLLGSRLTDVPGSSAWFQGGWITYSRERKVELMGEFTAGQVSETVACGLARAAAERAGTQWGVAVTGVAGPDGGTEENPVGSVWIAVSYQGKAEARRFRFPGDRPRIRIFTCQAALDMLRRRLINSEKLAYSSWSTPSPN